MECANYACLWTRINTRASKNNGLKNERLAVIDFKTCKNPMSGKVAFGQAGTLLIRQLKSNLEVHAMDSRIQV